MHTRILVLFLALSHTYTQPSIYLSHVLTHDKTQTGPEVHEEGDHAAASHDNAAASHGHVAAPHEEGDYVAAPHEEGDHFAVVHDDYDQLNSFQQVVLREDRPLKSGAKCRISSDRPHSRHQVRSSDCPLTPGGKTVPRNQVLSPDTILCPVTRLFPVTRLSPDIRLSPDTRLSPDIRC